jgi:hypothetical protein
MGIEFVFQVFPLALWTRFDHRTAVEATADVLAQHPNCSMYVSTPLLNEEKLQG